MSYLPIEHQDLRGLRVQDLVAKVAQVNLSSTVKVMMALDLVAAFLQTNSDDVLGDLRQDSADKAGSSEIDKCDQAFNRLLYAADDSDIGDAVRAIRAVAKR